MKTQKIFVLMLFALPLMTLLLACQNQGKDDDLLTSDISVTSRVDDCDDCNDINDCCCFVELYGDDAATIQLCGTSVGSVECSISNNASCSGSVDGILEIVSLGSLYSQHIFCMNPATALRITNISPSDDAGIRVGCNTYSTAAIEYDIPAQDSVFAETNISCVLSDCTS